MGGNGPVAWLGELMSVFWWKKLDLVSLEVNTVSISEFWGVYEFGMALDSLPFIFQYLVPILLED